MAPDLKPIEAKGSRWEPSADPHDIVVPGLDASASVNDQIEQIEQLITIKLQNIDANFSKIQHIMANRILPAVKRYAVGTEPVREAAKFWITFFEQAAQIRVPTYEDYDTQQDAQSEAEHEETQESTNNEASVSETPAHSRVFGHDATVSEVSFAPGQAAISSTPARHKGDFSDQTDATSSWNASIESPLVRLDREIQSLTRDEVSVASSMSQFHSHFDDSQDVTQRQIPATFTENQTAPRSGKGKGRGKDPAEPLLRGVLKRNVDISSTTAHVTATSPLKVKGKTPVLKSLNPYLPPDTNPSDWKGLVDLADPTVSTPGKYAKSPTKRRFGAQPSTSKRPTTPQLDDDSFDEGLGMSPPITMDFARLPKAKTPKLGKTPKKQAAERIMQSLLDIEKRGVFDSARTGSTYDISAMAKLGVGASVESSISTVPTPPSFSRYARHPYPPETNSSIADASLESMMRRVGLNVPAFGPSYGVPNSASKGEASPSYSSIPTSVFLPPSQSQSSGVPPPDSPETPETFHFNTAHLQDDEFNQEDPDSSMDSLDAFDEANNTANPSAAFIFASQQASHDDDSSFESNQSDDSLDEYDGMGGPIQPFGAEQDGDGFDDDDSFDDPLYNPPTEEETLFGVPPAQRLQAHAQFQNRASDQNLRMLGQELLEDTIGIGTQMAQAGRVEESPTPWGAARGS
ncbi:hypothetical protein EW026_g8009 [Hermanssonia centrifuga]|uniref:DASH complex subunit ASK1 n=1 Tax=Hermanssonia centrifuga TaxID=98765 RepID=A0A4V6S0T5_9APHY|nr:hypothetical protein EW026_g8009 [Hermanssonia centrifuga]